MQSGNNKKLKITVVLEIVFIVILAILLVVFLLSRTEEKEEQPVEEEIVETVIVDPISKEEYVSPEEGDFVEGDDSPNFGESISFLGFMDLIEATSQSTYIEFATQMNEIVKENFGSEIKYASLLPDSLSCDDFSCNFTLYLDGEIPLKIWMDKDPVSVTYEKQ